MAWLNHVVISAPRNATTTHTVSPSSGTAAAGTLFTPTSGSLLVCIVEGAVTSTTPTGWTLPSGGSAINNTGLYLFRRTASGTTADNITTTHNGSNYAVSFHFFEFDSTYSFVSVVSAINVAFNGGAGPAVTGLTGSNFVGYSLGQGVDNTTTATVTWSGSTEVNDTFVGLLGTDGYVYSTAYNEPVTAASSSSAATSTRSAVTVERLTWAVQSSGGGGAPAIPPIIVLAPRR